jgi:outer membrane receptor protein involved in Fe transport
VSLLIIGAYDATGVEFGDTSDFALIDPGSAGSAAFERQFSSEALNWQYDDGTTLWRTALGHLGSSQELRFGSLGEFSDNDSDRWTLRSQYERTFARTHTIAIGAELQRAEFEYATRVRYRSCSRFNPECETDRGPMTEATDDARMDSATAFVEDRWAITNAFALTLGVRGERQDYLDASYVEPRLAAQWQLDRQWELRAQWGQYHQAPRVLELLPVFGNPTLEPIEATHYVLGVTHRIDDTWSWSAEAYYKDLDNVIVDVPTAERYVNGASGEAYGIEIMLNKNRAPYVPGSHDRFYGWFALGLAKTERDNEVDGTSAVFDYDAPIVANLVVNYRWNVLWDAGLHWQFRSGMPYTPIVGNRENPDFPGYYLPVYGELNGSRASPYHRLYLRIERQFAGPRLQGSVYLDILNAYARENGGAVRYKPIPNSSSYELEEEDQLPLLPSIGIKLIF